jgi:hypothetical protein
MNHTQRDLGLWVDVVDRILKRFHSIPAEKSVDTQCPAPRFLSTVNIFSQDIAHLFSATHMPSNSCLLSMLMSFVRDDDFLINPLQTITGFNHSFDIFD